MMSSTLIAWKRFVVLWIVSFAVWYGSSLVFYSYWLATYNPIILFVSQVFAPIFLLVMGWFYFRGARNDWEARFAVSSLWIGAALVVTAALMGPVYGASWTGMLSQSFLFGQAMNIVALIVGGYLAKPVSANRGL